MQDPLLQMEVLINEEELQKRVLSLGRQISKDYKGEHLHLVCILNGAWVFLADLVRHLQLDTSIDFMTVSSYSSGIKSTGSVRIVKDLDRNIRGLHVLVVEDIYDTGLTLDHLRKKLERKEPKSLAIVTLLSKPKRRLKEVDVKYIGFEIPDQFVVGYGLDYQQRFRNLPSISRILNYETKIPNRKRT